MNGRGRCVAPTDQAPVRPWRGASSPVRRGTKFSLRENFIFSASRGATPEAARGSRARSPLRGSLRSRVLRARSGELIFMAPKFRFFWLRV